MSQGETPAGTRYGIVSDGQIPIFRPCPAIAPLNLAGISAASLVTCQREEGHDGAHRLLILWDGAVTRIRLTDMPSAGQ